MCCSLGVVTVLIGYMAHGSASWGTCTYLKDRKPHQELCFGAWLQSLLSMGPWVSQLRHLLSLSFLLCLCRVPRFTEPSDVSK